jgi:hypothetical protein
VASLTAASMATGVWIPIRAVLLSTGLLTMTDERSEANMATKPKPSWIDGSCRGSARGRTEGRLVRAAIVLLIVVSLTGCISRNHVGNWRPQDASVSRNYNECWRQNRPAGLGKLEHCMVEQGYRPREMTDGEILAAVVLFPLWFPLAILTRGNFIRILGPNDDAN